MRFQIVHNGTVHDIGVDLGRLHTFVSQQFLYGRNIYTILYKKSCVGVTGGVEWYPLVDFGPSGKQSELFVDVRIVFQAEETS